MSVIFSRERLHVGYRASDWSSVWYGPIDGEDDSEVEMGLFRFKSSEKLWTKNPMDGEVHWHPPFDIALCESKKLGQRRTLQKQFLYNAWDYLKEKDPERVQQMEQELDQPGFSRWQNWFFHAKKLKHSRLRAAERRAAAKAARLAAGQDMMDEDSDTDSAYETESESNGRLMYDGQTGTTEKGARKRKAPADSADGAANSSKKKGKEKESAIPSDRDLANDGLVAGGPSLKLSFSKAAAAPSKSGAARQAAHLPTHDEDDVDDEDGDNDESGPRFGSEDLDAMIGRIRGSLGAAHRGVESGLGAGTMPSDAIMRTSVNTVQTPPMRYVSPYCVSENDEDNLFVREKTKATTGIDRPGNDDAGLQDKAHDRVVNHGRTTATHDASTPAVPSESTEHNH